MLDDELHCRVVVIGDVCLREDARDGKVSRNKHRKARICSSVQRDVDFRKCSGLSIAKSRMLVLGLFMMTL
jgi:hypothetical protein